MSAYITDKLAGSAAPTTLQKRIAFLIGLYDLVSQEKGFQKDNSFEFLNETDIVLDRLNSYSNFDTRWNLLWHILMAIRADPTGITQTTKETYESLLPTLKEARDNKRLNNVKNEKQKRTLHTDLSKRQAELQDKITDFFNDNNLPYEKLTDAKFNRIQNKVAFAKRFQDLVIMAVYLFQPALRNDWADLNITVFLRGLSDDKNYLYIKGNDMRLIMNVYKNSRSMGKQVISLTPDTVEILKIWLDFLKKMLGVKPSKPFMYNFFKNKTTWLENEDAMRRAIPRVAENVFGIKMSINDFRHLWEIDFQQNPDWNYKNLTGEQRKKLHAMLLHSTETAQGYNLQDA